MLKVVTIILAVIFILFAIKVLIDRSFGDKSENYFYKFIDHLHDLDKLSKILWKWVVKLTHFLGVVFIIILLSGSIVSFVYVVFQELGDGMLWFKEPYGYISNIIKNPISWATATTIVATTIAVGHMQNQNINKKYLKRNGKRC